MQWPASARSGGQPAAADYPRGREDRGNISFSYMGYCAAALHLVPRGDPGSCTHETDWLGGWEGYYDRDECTKVQGCGSETVCHHVLCSVLTKADWIWQHAKSSTMAAEAARVHGEPARSGTACHLKLWGGTGKLGGKRMRLP